jgi:hypothetical protein
MRKGADTIGTLHFAHFVALLGNYLGFFTVYDGTFEKYMQDFTQKIGPIFDVLYKFVTNAPPLPVAKNSEAFTNAAAEYPPIGFYSAYPGLAVQDIKALYRVIELQHFRMGSLFSHSCDDLLLERGQLWVANHSTTNHNCV